MNVSCPICDKIFITIDISNEYDLYEYSYYQFKCCDLEISLQGDSKNVDNYYFNISLLENMYSIFSYSKSYINIDYFYNNFVIENVDINYKKDIAIIYVNDPNQYQRYIFPINNFLSIKEIYEVVISFINNLHVL